MVMVVHPGSVAMCPASQPTVPDFSCGFQPHLSSGTRSRTLRVFCISWSNSPSIDWPIVMVASLEGDLSCGRCSAGILGEQKANCQAFVGQPFLAVRFTIDFHVRTQRIA